MTRSRMVQSGVRPDKYTFQHEAEGLVKLGDARAAMAAVKSLRTTAGAGRCRGPQQQDRLLHMHAGGLVCLRACAAGLVAGACALTPAAPARSPRPPGAGGLRLLEPGSLAGLLALLAEKDMPVDLLQLLVYMSEDSCR